MESRIDLMSDREREDKKKEPKEILLEDDVQLGLSEALKQEDWD